jgi:hypothetical protein
LEGVGIALESNIYLNGFYESLEKRVFPVHLMGDNIFKTYIGGTSVFIL